MATTADTQTVRVDPEIRKFAVETGASGIRYDGTHVRVQYRDTETEASVRVSRIPDGYDPIISPDPWMTVDFFNSPTN